MCALCGGEADLECAKDARPAGGLEDPRVLAEAEPGKRESGQVGHPDDGPGVRPCDRPAARGMIAAVQGTALIMIRCGVTMPPRMAIMLPMVMQMQMAVVVMQRRRRRRRQSEGGAPARRLKHAVLGM